jgi:ribosomal protein L15
LIVELIVANIFWKEHCKHTFAFAPIALLAAVAAWKIVLIAVLAVAIWLVGIYNICAFKKFKGKYNDTAVYDAEYPPEYAAQYIFLTHQLERKSVVEPSYSMYIPEKSTTEAGNELQDNRGNSYYIPDRQGTIVTPPPEDEIRRRSIITPPIKQDEKVAQPIVVAEPEMLKLSLSEAAEAGEPIEIVDDDGEIREVIRSVDATTGYAIIVGYSRSFLSRLIQSSDETKYYYSSLKNKILSYTDARARMWWNFDSIMFGRNVIAKFGFRDKTLCMYFALDADMYTAQYKVEKIQSKRYEEVPCMARIKNDKRKAVAEALIEELAKKFGMTANKIHNEDYYYPYDTTAALIEKGLIKEVVKRELYEEYRTRHNLSDGEDPYIEDESTSPMETYDSSTRPVNEEIRQLMAPHNYDYLSQSATEEMNGEPYVDEVESELDLLDNGPIEDGQPVPEVKHTKPGKPKKTEKPEKEEKAEEKPKKPRAKKKPEEVEVHVVEHVNIKEADEMLSNDDAEVLVDDESVGRPIGRNKYAINVDTLSKNFKAKEHVTLQSLKDKNLLPAKADSFKVLARGVLDKPLIVEADAYSIEAVKMIVLTGGKVIKV